MKARTSVMVAPRSLEMREIAVPEKLPPGHSLLRVEANGLCGGDFEHYEGKFDIALPTILGHEIVGTIEQLSSEMARESGLSEGDRIVLQQTTACEACKECVRGRRLHCKEAVTYGRIPLSVEPGLWGGYATHMVLRPRTRMYKIPASLSAEDASLFNPLSNGFHWTIEVAQAKLGDRVLVLGAGQRGLMCALAAHEAGAAQIILTGLTRDASKFALAQKFGATDFINVETENVVERVNELTSGEGVDCGVDTVPVSGQSILDALQALRPQGTLALAGVKGNEPIRGLLTDTIWWKALTIRGAFQASVWAAQNAARVLGESRYPFSEMHSHRFSLEEADYALRILGNEVDGVSPLHITLVP